MRVIVCGGRDYHDSERVWRVLDGIHARECIHVVGHGAARGADSLAGAWARERGVMEFARPAQWTEYGRAAGPRRNSELLREVKPALVVVFPGGAGTADMRRKAQRQRGVKVVTVAESGGSS